MKAPLEGVSPTLGRLRSRLNSLDLRFFIITMALRNIRISTSLWNRIKVTGMLSTETMWVGKGAKKATEIQMVRIKKELELAMA